MNPVIINFDVATLLWLNSFALNLRQSLVTAHEENSSTQTTPLNYIDVKIEAIMPRVIILFLLFNILVLTSIVLIKTVVNSELRKSRQYSFLLVIRRNNAIFKFSKLSFHQKY